MLLQQGTRLVYDNINYYDKQTRNQLRNTIVYTKSVPVSYCYSSGHKIQAGSKITIFTTFRIMLTQYNMFTGNIFALIHHYKV